MSPLYGESERLTLGISDVDQISMVARALSVPKRIEILKLLGQKNIMSVNEIAHALSIPISSTSLNNWTS